MVAEAAVAEVGVAWSRSTIRALCEEITWPRGCGGGGMVSGAAIQSPAVRRGSDEGGCAMVAPTYIEIVEPVHHVRAAGGDSAGGTKSVRT